MGRMLQLMGVDRLRLGRHQPFFHCLVDERDRPGGTTTYVAQVPGAGCFMHCHSHHETGRRIAPSLAQQHLLYNHTRQIASSCHVAQLR